MQEASKQASNFRGSGRGFRGRDQQMVADSKAGTNKCPTLITLRTFRDSAGSGKKRAGMVKLLWVRVAPDETNATFPKA